MPPLDKTIDGIDYARIHVSELESGMVTVFGETVESAKLMPHGSTIVYMTNGETSVYGRAASTLLIRLDSIEADD